MSNIEATCTGGDGPDLTGYPLLAYAPRQWGDCVVIASSGLPVAKIASRAGEMPEGHYPWHEAEAFGISVDELAEAIRYVQEHR